MWTLRLMKSSSVTWYALKVFFQSCVSAKPKVWLRWNLCIVSQWHSLLELEMTSSCCFDIFWNFDRLLQILRTKQGVIFVFFFHQAFILLPETEHLAFVHNLSMSSCNTFSCGHQGHISYIVEKKILVNIFLLSTTKQKTICTVFYM